MLLHLNLFILFLLIFHVLAGAGMSPGPHISGLLPPPAARLQEIQEISSSVCVQPPPDTGDSLQTRPNRNYWDEDHLCSPLSRQQRAEAKPGQSLPAHCHWDTGQQQWKSFSLGKIFSYFYVDVKYSIL